MMCDFWDDMIGILMKIFSNNKNIERNAKILSGVDPQGTYLLAPPTLDFFLHRKDLNLGPLPPH